jgi:hypothetical protein
VPSVSEAGEGNFSKSPSTRFSKSARCSRRENLPSPVNGRGEERAENSVRILGKIVLALAIICTAGNAHAGAWTQDQGKVLVIVTGSYYTTNEFFDNSGHKQSQPTYSKYELNPYAEYGLKDGITIGTNLFLDRARQAASPGVPDQTNWGLGDSEFFLRARLWQKDGFALAAEPMIKLPSPDSPSHMPQLGGSHPDAGLGLSGGYGFPAFGLNHFADVDTQYRYRFGAAKDQLRINATLGISVMPRLMIMPQAFVIYRTATPRQASFTESPADDYDQIKLQLSAVYQLSNGTSLQLGGFDNVAGKNTGGGGGALFAVWERF